MKSVSSASCARIHLLVSAAFLAFFSPVGVHLSRYEVRGTRDQLPAHLSRSSVLFHALPQEHGLLLCVCTHMVVFLNVLFVRRT